MIKFFRHIRQQLLSEGNTGKPALPAGRYLKYAIGEIILVVIGILIALQINNWNEAKKDRSTEVKLLKELREDLIKTKEDLLTDIDKTTRILNVTDSIYLNIIESRAMNEDSHIKILNSQLSNTHFLF